MGNCFGSCSKKSKNSFSNNYPTYRSHVAEPKSELLDHSKDSLVTLPNYKPDHHVSIPSNAQSTDSAHLPISTPDLRVSIPANSPLCVAVPQNLRCINQAESQQVRVTADSIEITQKRIGLYQRPDNNTYITLAEKEEFKLSVEPGNNIEELRGRQQLNAIPWNSNRI